MRERSVSDEEVGVTKGFAVQACFYIIVVYGESIEEYLFVVLFQVFKNSPIISWRIEDANDSDSYVDKGILIDTYYCVSDDVITVIPTFKNTNYNCPSE